MIWSNWNNVKGNMGEMQYTYDIDKPPRSIRFGRLTFLYFIPEFDPEKLFIVGYLISNSININAKQKTVRVKTIEDEELQEEIKKTLKGIPNLNGVVEYKFW